MQVNSNMIQQMTSNSDQPRLLVEKVVKTLFDLFSQQGDSAYHGERVSQTEHALQAALAAENAQVPSTLVTAALLHDLGHLLSKLPEHCAQDGVDDHHEDLASTWLQRYFGPEVTEPIRLHVSAKRYLCAVEPEYWESLSAASKLSLRLQGGPMSAAEVQQFQANPYYQQAVALRRWDDQAKAPGLAIPPLEHFRGHLETALLQALPQSDGPSVSSLNSSLGLAAGQKSRSSPDRIALVIFDWAGTTVDFGCFAPISAALEVFAQHGLPATAQQARQPMGLGKRDHLREMLRQPAITAAWRDRHHREWTEADIDQIYNDFVPKQLEAVQRFGRLTPGLLECVAKLRSWDIRIGSTTGYFREAADLAAQEAAKQGFHPDHIACVTDVPAGRPAPWMIFRNMEALGVYPASAVVKVGDTVPDILEGLHADCWTVGVTSSGSIVGLTEQELAQLPAAERQQRLSTARQLLLQAGAHRVIDSLAELPDLVVSLNRELTAGKGP